jgi:hypothetical protein
MRNPSKLRYVECELPDEVERAIIAFEDAFDDSIKPFYERLNDFVVNDLANVQAEITAQIDLREQLLTGSPVQSLSSLAALDASTNLTSPKRDDTDPETIRIDERKLGAAGLCLINGRVYKMLTGDRISALRHLWECAGGDYDYFVRLGTAVYTTPLDNYNLFEYNTSTPTKLPFVNKGFTYLEAVGLKNSQFKHRMVWTRGVSASYALKAKMATLGYDSTQINNMFSGLNPNADYDFIGVIGNIRNLIRSVTRLLFMPSTDPVRQPAWENEANYIELAIKTFLAYRTKKYSTSSFFDTDFWLSFLSELRPADIKELLENRPEIKNIELPQDMDSLTLAIEKAIAVPAETTLINTYMNNLPSGKDEELNLTTTLYDLGLAIYRELVFIKATRAPSLELLLIELIGKPALIDFINEPILINHSDLSSLFPTTNLPPVGALVSSIQSRPDSALISLALSANSATDKFSKSESRTVSQENQKAESGSTTNNTPSGVTQGFPTEDTFAMLLTRRIKWDLNFQDCEGSSSTFGTSSTPIDQQMRTVKSFDETSSVESNEEWRAHKENIAYLKERILLSGDSISDIRTALSTFLRAEAQNGTISLSDTRINEPLSTANTSNDVKIVAKAAVAVVKAIPEKIEASSTTEAASGGYNIGEGMYAAKNRNQIEEQGGKTPPASGLSQKEVAGLENALGKTLPFLGINNSGGTIPFKASTSMDLQICQNKALKGFDNFLKGILTPPAWLVRFINIVKHQIIMFQDRIDKFILTIQQVMDAILAKLERLLTLDLNFSGKLGFENSLFKCSWGIDLGLKINLLDLLLMYLDRFLSVILAPILKLLQLFSDFINEILCIPIQWLQTILNGAAAALSALLGLIGCTLKDFKLPPMMFDLLNLISGIFNLRSLVLKKGSADWLKMMGRIKLGKDEFAGLSQFAGMCANPNLSKAISALQSAMGLAVSDIPVAAAPAPAPMAGESNYNSAVVA